MNPLESLGAYLRRVERRIYALVLTRGAAATAGAALLLTVLLVFVADHFAFRPAIVTAARVILYGGLAAAIGGALVLPLLRANRREAARSAERRYPLFDQRLLTFAERDGAQDPFLELLAADTLELTHGADPAAVAPRARLAAFASLAAGAAGLLVWLAIAGPGFLGYGTSLLWAGTPKGGARPFYEIIVEPGDRTIRRNTDQKITARVLGMNTSRVRLFARYGSTTKWEATGMTPQPDAPGFEFLLTAVPEPLEYYVEAGNLRSKTYRLSVRDLPAIRGLKVTYRYPAWTGMKDETEDPGGDLRAVEGTLADLEIRTDRPLGSGALLLDDGSKIPLRTISGNVHQARIPIQKDGLYHVASVEQGETVRLSEDYFIEARRDSAPTVRITRPGRDSKVSPIEEVAVAVEAQDDFGLRAVDLHYSVNGGPEKVLALGGGRVEGGGTATLYLEDFKLAPGDVVSIYGTARDARSSARTDIYFLEAQPFEREYSQSQVAGGQGGGGGEEENTISQRQKEIIAATWNELRGLTKSAGESAENASFLSGMQAKLEAQARSLARRMRSRQLGSQAESFNTFVREMEQAAEAMTPAAQQLKSSRWREALQPEQKALQHLLRAEATFRQIQVAFGQQGGGGGGRNMGRDLESLFDLELDTEKNQYESGQQSASGGERQKEIDEALAKLEQLARRQQELAAKQRSQAQTPQQRWQQEMLRREAEQLRRQMDQLARSGGSQLDRALNQLSQATRDMQGGGAEGSARAAERLRQAREQLAGMRREQNTGQLDSLAQRSGELASVQQDLANRLRRQVGSEQAARDRQAAEQLAQEQRRLSQEYEQLERDVQRAARDLNSTHREAAGKVRRALGDVQQEEPAARMQWLAEAIRRGYGAYAVPRAAPVTNALSNLHEHLREAQAALERDQSGKGGIEQALNRLERLRQQLSRSRQPGEEANARGSERTGAREGEGRQGADGRRNGESRQAGQGQQGEGQQGGERAGGRAGEHGSTERQGGGEAGGGFPAINRGDWQPAPGGSGVAQGYRDTLRELAEARRGLEGEPGLVRDMDDLVRQMRRLDPSRFPGNPQLLERMRSELLPAMERLELQLRRKLDDQQNGVRAGAAEAVPPGYADAVAEYFRRLSNGGASTPPGTPKR